jgi:hypothetical protein
VRWREHGWLPLQHAGNLEQCGAAGGVRHPLLYVGEDPPGTFKTEHALELEPRGRDVPPELLGLVEVRGHEVVQALRRIAMLPLSQIPGDDLRESRVA